jgi:hypothetical protein
MINIFIILFFTFSLCIAFLSEDNNRIFDISDKLQYNDVLRKDIKIKEPNFTKISEKDMQCKRYYENNVQYLQNNVDFSEYLEFWWDTEEDDTTLIKWVCNFIYSKYPKRYIRMKASK